jgi:hypothetical protein
MAKSSFPYYPPRARWYGFLFDLGYAARRRLTLDRIRLDSRVPLGRLLGGLLVPGLAFWLRGERFRGAFAPVLCALLLVLFLAFLGYPLGNVAFGLLLSAHATGFVLLCEPWTAGDRFRSRMLFSLAVLLLFTVAFYVPARAFLQAHWVMPLQLDGRVIIVRPTALPADYRDWPVRRGDWIAYSIRERYSGGVSVQAGVGFGPVLAVPKDRVRFTPDALEVNAVRQPRRPNMPMDGEWVVPEKHWFVWPDLNIGGHGNLPGAALSTTLFELATISQEQLIGKPFKWWFWRRQVLL